MQSRRKASSSFNSVSGHNDAQREDISHALRFHWATAQLARVVYEDPKIQETKEPAAIQKFFDLEIGCLKDLLKRDPAHQDAKQALLGAQGRHDEVIKRVTSARPELLRMAYVNDPQHRRHKGLQQRHNTDHAPKQTSAERLDQLRKKEQKRNEFMQTMRQRRQQLESEAPDHHHNEEEF